MLWIKTQLDNKKGHATKLILIALLSVAQPVFADMSLDDIDHCRQIGSRGEDIFNLKESEGKTSNEIRSFILKQLDKEELFLAYIADAVDENSAEDAYVRVFKECMMKTSLEQLGARLERLK